MEYSKSFSNALRVRNEWAEIEEEARESKEKFEGIMIRNAPIKKGDLVTVKQNPNDFMLRNVGGHTYHVNHVWFRSGNLALIVYPLKKDGTPSMRGRIKARSIEDFDLVETKPTSED